MKYFFYLFLFTCMLFSSYNAGAYELKFGEEIDIVEPLSEDIYTFAGRIDLSADIFGDFVALGGEIHVDGAIEQDATLFGGEVVISKEIGDDVRVTGGSILIQADVLGDLIVFGGDVRIAREVTVYGDLLAYAGNVIVDGTVKGDTKIGAGKFILNGKLTGDADIYVESFSTPSGSGAIEGNLDYTYSERLSGLESLANGEITFSLETDENWEESILDTLVNYVIFKIIGVFIFACLLYFSLEKIFHKVAIICTKQKGKSALFGFLLIVGTPVLMLLLCLTVIGIPFGLLILFLYIFMFVFAKLLNVLVVSSIIIDTYNLQQLWKKCAIILGFSILFSTVGIINFIIAIFTLGAILIYKVDVVQQLRK